MTYIVVEYKNINTNENINKNKQPLKIVYKDDDIFKAKNYAYNHAIKIYGDYVEDLKDINNEYIKNHFWNVECIAEYSDWSVDMFGNSDNIVYAVVEINL